MSSYVFCAFVLPICASWKHKVLLCFGWEYKWCTVAAGRRCMPFRLFGGKYSRFRALALCNEYNIFFYITVRLKFTLNYIMQAYIFPLYVMHYLSWMQRVTCACKKANADMCLFLQYRQVSTVSFWWCNLHGNQKIKRISWEPYYPKKAKNLWK